MVKCIKCSRAYIDLGVGFASKPRIFCSRDGCEVFKNDGCTLGQKGEPMYKVMTNKVDISGHECVWGG